MITWMLVKCWPLSLHLSSVALIGLSRGIYRIFSGVGYLKLIYKLAWPKTGKSRNVFKLYSIVLSVWTPSKAWKEKSDTACLSFVSFNRLFLSFTIFGCAMSASSSFMSASTSNLKKDKKCATSLWNTGRSLYFGWTSATKFVKISLKASTSLRKPISRLLTTSLNSIKSLILWLIGA